MMYLIRRTEEVLMAEYHPADEMRCPMHFCVGQESAPAALSLLVQKNDVMMSHYRSHGYYLGKGGPLPAMVAEFYGKTTGSNGGLAGSMELGSHEQNFCSGAIVGGSMLIPLGTAFAHKYRGTKDISISVFGDGSFDEGITYESMNLAALHKLPLLIICENNKYAANTDIALRLGNPRLLPKVEAMGIPGEVVDGYDLEQLVGVLADAVAAVRSGGGPRYVEVETYRFCAHVGPQPDDYLEYRSTDEIAEWRSKDPLGRLRAQLMADPAASRQVAQIEAEVEQDVAAAVSSAKTAPFPSLEWALGVNWANTYAPIVEGFFREVQPAFRGGQNETRLEPF
jgi:TPP-dependent pyruvate/acetoin dehydrogenase alpha subunit